MMHFPNKSFTFCLALSLAAVIYIYHSFRKYLKFRVEEFVISRFSRRAMTPSIALDSMTSQGVD